MDHVSRFKAGMAAGFAVLTALWGWFGWLVVGWIFCMALDYLTGSFAALKSGEWSSRVAREGIWHKTGSIIAVVIAGVLDLVVGQILGNVPPDGLLPFRYSVFLCPLVVVWYILTEAGSIVENAGRLGAPIPEWLCKAITALRKTVDEGGESVRPPDT